MCCVLDPCPYIHITILNMIEDRLFKEYPNIILSGYEGIYYRIYYRIYDTLLLSDGAHPWLPSGGSVETSLQPLREEVAVEPRMGLKIRDLLSSVSVATWDNVLDEMAVSPNKSDII